MQLAMLVGTTSFQKAVLEVKTELEANNIKITNRQFRSILFGLGFNFLGNIIENVHIIDSQPKNEIVNLFFNGLMFCFSNFKESDKNLH